MDIGVFNFSKIMEFDLKWVHMARYELILRLDGALWLRIVFQLLLTPQRPMDAPKFPKEFPCAPTGGYPLFNGALPNIVACHDIILCCDVSL